jgi:hypothetical protein
MAEIAKVNGNTLAPSEQIGRDIVFIGIQATNTVLNDALPDVDGVTPSITNLDLVRQVIDSASSITLIGEVANDDDVMFMVEGAGFGGPGSGAETIGQTGAGTIGFQVQINAIRDAVEALNGGALGTTICTIQHIAGVVFVVDFTDN